MSLQRLHIRADKGFALGLTRTLYPAVASGVNQNPAPKSREPSRKPSESVERLPDLLTWHYHDADGNVAFAVQRRDTPEGKRFIQWTPDGAGWIPKAPQGKKPLYGLPAILKSTGRVAVVEGEKCADACRKAYPSQTVTTWAGGSNAWNRTDWQPLKGREVSILADGDEPGRKAARGIAVILHALGCKGRSWQRPEGDDGNDVADWLAEDGAGRNRQAYRRHAEGLSAPRARARVATRGKRPARHSPRGPAGQRTLRDYWA